MNLPPARTPPVDILMTTNPPSKRTGLRKAAAFSMTDLLMVIAAVFLLVALATPALVGARAKARLAVCVDNLKKIDRAVLQFADENKGALPSVESSQPPGGWWWYKEQVKGYAGLSGLSSARDQVFACPNDRGYGAEDAKPLPFSQSPKHDFTSYVFNGVNLPGMPNIAGQSLGSIREPAKTLLVMEWTAHGPLSWHRSKTGRKNAPFYNDAESVVGFVDGHVGLIKIYYDGINAAYTRDPVPGYAYRYSGN